MLVSHETGRATGSGCITGVVFEPTIHMTMR